MENVRMDGNRTSWYASAQIEIFWRTLVNAEFYLGVPDSIKLGIYRYLNT